MGVVESCATASGLACVKVKRQSEAARRSCRWSKAETAPEGCGLIRIDVGRSARGLVGATDLSCHWPLLGRRTRATHRRRYPGSYFLILDDMFLGARFAHQDPHDGFEKSLGRME